MTESYPELIEEVEELHGEEIARMPYNNNVSKELVAYLRSAKRIDRNRVLNTIGRLAKKAENDSGR